jgi:5-methyltetrahydropteroyltriglutamate--homocysteine methyltransferase
MKNKGKIKQTKILTAIVGSYPKPKYLYQKDARELINSTGFLFDKHAKEIGKRSFNKLLDKAAQEVIEDQNKAGIDVVTDGEVRRSQYVMHILKGLYGIDFKKLKRTTYRGGVYIRDLPTITGAITYQKPILVKDFEFTKKHAKGIAKICLPGPSTAVDSLVDEYYEGDLERAAYDYANAIRQEVAQLIKSGCRVIQFDDPVLLRFPDRAKKWGIQTLQRCFEGLEDQALFVVHICRGYPNKPLEKKGINYKANKEYYRDILSWLADSKLDVISIEGAQSNLDLSILPAIGKKTIMLGVLDVGVNTVESVASLVKRGKEAIRYLPKEQLILSPDCGLIELTRNAAYKKLKNMVLAAKELNETPNAVKRKL